MDLQRSLRRIGYVLRADPSGGLSVHCWPRNDRLVPLTVLGLDEAALILRFRAPFPGRWPQVLMHGDGRTDGRLAPVHSSAVVTQERPVVIAGIVPRQPVLLLQDPILDGTADNPAPDLAPVQPTADAITRDLASVAGSPPSKARATPPCMPSSAEGEAGLAA